MPITLEERKAEIDKLTDRMVELTRQIFDLQRQANAVLQAAVTEYGLAAAPLLEIVLKKAGAAALYAIPPQSTHQM